MSRKFIFATVATVCLAMVFSPLMATERTRSDSDRGKRTSVEHDDRSIPETFNDLTRARTERVRQPDSTAATASKLLSAAKSQTGDAAIAALNQVLQLGLESSTETDKILAEAHVMLGDLYQGSASKQVAYYGIALQFTSEPAARQAVERKIQDLGGDVFALTFNGTQAPTMGTRDLGVRDTCDAAEAVALDYSSGFVLNIDNSIPGFPDYEWFSFDVPGPDGWSVRIETLTDMPGTTQDDTDLTLWGGCTGGIADTQIAFNDDSPLANGPYMSRIDTGCLLPGTYYVEVGGWIDVSSPDNFELQIAVEGTCELPAVDAYEPDDDRADAAEIGLPTSIPSHANGWGRAKKEIQDRTIFPVGDVDNARFSLSRVELVNMGTATTFPTFFNGFTDIAANDDNDTVMDLRYGVSPNYGGFCNDPGNGFPNACFVDADCDGLVIAPLPGFPDCIPLFLFSGFGAFNDPSLAFNDDAGIGVRGSELTMCLPPSIQTSGDGTTADSWLVEVNPWSSSDIFEYQLRVRNLTRCTFESEPNNDFLDANPLTLGDTVHGIFDFSVTFPFQDSDLWSFDVEEESLVTFETLGYDSFAVDTAFETYVGPDDNGDFFTLGAAGTNDDGGSGFLSLISYVLPPANDLLGNTTADADYFLNVTSFYLNPNFPYTLTSSIAGAPLVESEPNDDCGTNANAVDIGDDILASINPAGDHDAFLVTVGSNTFIDLATAGAGDTVMKITDSSNVVLACDDDGGPGLLSAISGCLAPGTYCVEVKAFSAGATFNYSLSVGGGGSCPTPGSVSGTGGLGCPF